MAILQRVLFRLTPVALLAAVLTAAVAWVVTARGATSPQRYYLALGDSLTVGMQPNAAGADRATSQGFVQDVAGVLTAGTTDLTTVNLGGCGAYTARGAVTQAGCRTTFASGTMLSVATRFLSLHRSQTSLVTVELGDNDVEPCVHPSGVDQGCVNRGLATVKHYLTTIATQLRRVAPSVRIVGVADYDQFLAYWLWGSRGKRVARESVAVIKRLAQTVSAVYRKAGVHVADAGAFFRTGDFTPVRTAGYGTLPRAVARVCSWTWACQGAPKKLDDHANAAGYRVIAAAVVAQLP